MKAIATILFALVVIVRPFDEPGIYRVEVINQTTGDVFVRFADTDTVLFTARASQATYWNVDYFDSGNFTKRQPAPPKIALRPDGQWVQSLPGVTVNFINTHQ